jgi:hypothetical protein
MLRHLDLTLGGRGRSPSEKQLKTRETKALHATLAILSTVISMASLAVAIASYKEAKTANKLSDDNIRIVAEPTTAGLPSCDGYTLSIPLTWQIFIFNNSIQPITIERIEYTGYSNYGIALQIDESGKHGPTSEQLPITIAARGSTKFVATVPVNAPKRYARWYQASGLCNNRSLDVQKVASQAGFTVTGGTPDHPSYAGIAVSLETSDGHMVGSQVNWDDPIKLHDIGFKLPPQGN